MITALISRKGGVGKTTSAVNLSAALAAQGLRVLLVDLDSQASASLSLGVDRAKLAPSAADVLFSGLPAAQARRPTSVPGLDLITASVDLVKTESELAAFRGKETRLKSLLAPIVREYDYIFLDCPSSLSLVTVNALAAADGFVVPVVPQFLAVTGVPNLISTAERVAWDHGSRLRFLGLLLTMVDYRVKSSAEDGGRDPGRIRQRRLRHRDPDQHPPRRGPGGRADDLPVRPTGHRGEGVPVAGWGAAAAKGGEDDHLSPARFPGADLRLSYIKNSEY